MIARSLTLFFCLLPGVMKAQTGNRQLADSLQYITGMPYICRSAPIATTPLPVPGCGDPLFWRVVQQKLDIVPLLIDKLTDTSETVAIVSNFGGQYTVADIAHSAILEIVRMPTYVLLKVRFDNKGCGDCSYWKHVRSSYTNRIKFQTEVRAWYKANKMKLSWAASNDFATCDCSFPHPNGGHYAVK